MITVIIILGLIFLYLSYKNLELASLVLIAALPLYVVRFSLFGLPSTLLELFVLILFLVWLCKNYQTIFHQLKKNLLIKKISQRYPFDWEMVAWLLVALGAVVVAGSSFKSLGVWRAYFLEPILLFIVFVNVFKSQEKIIKIAYAFSISALVVAGWAIVQYLTGQFIPNDFWAQAGSRRATSLFPYPNAVGLYLAPIIFFLGGTLPVLYKKSKASFIFIAVTIFLSLVAILFAKSEGAIFALILVFGLSLLFINQISRKIFLILILVGGLGLSFIPTFRSYVFDRVTLNNFSGQVRKIQWRETINMLYQSRLVTGVGLANYQAAVEPFHQVGFFFNKEKLANEEFVSKIKNDKSFRDSHWQPLEIYLYPHNIILNFWSELGLLGVLLFAWLLVRYFVAGSQAYILAIKQQDQFAWIILGLLLAMLAIIVHGIVDVPYFKNDLAVMFWLWFALVGLSNKFVKTKHVKDKI